MKKNQYSDYENYILLADKCGINSSYPAYLNFKDVRAFLNQIVTKTEDTFLHDGTIYKKRITSNEATKFLESLTKGRCDVDILRKIGTQLCIRV